MSCCLFVRFHRVRMCLLQEYQYEAEEAGEEVGQVVRRRLE